MKRTMRDVEELLRHSLPAASDEQMENAIQRVSGELWPGGIPAGRSMPAPDSRSVRHVNKMRWLAIASIAAAITITMISLAQNTVRTLGEYWFDDDDWHREVQYLISAEELREYRQVKNTQDRDNFISQFWTRRDPSPGTPQNEFRDEFYRRLKYANAHFANPANPSHNGMETDRGLFYLLYGAPDNNENYPSGAYEIWRYAAPVGIGSAFRIEFSVPPIDSCDGSYRILSAPMAYFKDGTTSVQVYPGRFITVSIPMNFSEVSSVEWMLRTRNGEPVVEDDFPILEGQFGPSRANQPLSLHLLGCRMFENSGMGFSHRVPPGIYSFLSVITFTSGEVKKESVQFEIN